MDLSAAVRAAARKTKTESESKREPPAGAGIPLSAAVRAAGHKTESEREPAAGARPLSAAVQAAAHKTESEREADARTPSSRLSFLKSVVAKRHGACGSDLARKRKFNMTFAALRKMSDVTLLAHVSLTYEVNLSPRLRLLKVCLAA